MDCDDKILSHTHRSQLADRRSMDVSMHGNVSYDTVTSFSKDNKAPNTETSSGKDAPSYELMYDTIDSRRQVERNS